MKVLPQRMRRSLRQTSPGKLPLSLHHVKFCIAVGMSICCLPTSKGCLHCQYETELWVINLKDYYYVFTGKEKNAYEAMTLNRMWRLDLQTQQRVFCFTEIKHRYDKYYDLKTLHKFSKLFQKILWWSIFWEFFFDLFYFFNPNLTAFPAPKSLFSFELIFLGILSHGREEVMNDMGITSF